MTPAAKASLNSCLLHWFDRHGRDFPWRRTTDPYAVLMAEMMLQRTRADQVRGVWTRFMARWPTLADASNASDEELLSVLRPLGLRWRIDNIIRVVHTLSRLTGPDDLKGVVGVGHYAVSAVRCFAFGERVPVVDANVVRFYSRIFGFPASDRTRRDPAFHAFARDLLPEARWKEYNWALIDASAAARAKFLKDGPINAVSQKLC